MSGSTVEPRCPAHGARCEGQQGGRPRGCCREGVAASGQAYPAAGSAETPRAETISVARDEGPVQLRGNVGMMIVTRRAQNPKEAAVRAVVVGGPTHVHGMSSERSREGAVDQAAKDDDLELDPEAVGDGLRDWFGDLARDVGAGKLAAAFDTRVDASTLITGQASKGITKRLRAHGFEMALDNESFFVDKSNHLEHGEADRAIEWGRSVAAAAQRDR